MSHSLCVFGNEAGDPAGLRFSVTHNINHVTEVGQTEQEIHLKCAGTARAGGRYCGPELITKWPHAAGSGCYCFSELKSKPGPSDHFQELPELQSSVKHLEFMWFGL